MTLEISKISHVLSESFPCKYFNCLEFPPLPLNSIFYFGIYIQEWKGWVKWASGSREGHNLTFFLLVLNTPSLVVRLLTLPKL